MSLPISPTMCWLPLTTGAACLVFSMGRCARCEIPGCGTHLNNGLCQLCSRAVTPTVAGLSDRLLRFYRAEVPALLSDGRYVSFDRDGVHPEANCVRYGDLGDDLERLLAEWVSRMELHASAMRR